MTDERVERSRQHFETTLEDLRSAVEQELGWAPRLSRWAVPLAAAAVGVALAPLAQSDDATSRRVVALELARWRRDRVSLMTTRPAIWPRPRDADAGTRPVVEAMRDQLWGRVELERPAVIELLAACSGRLANGAGCDDTLPARVTSELRRYLDEGCAALQLALAPVAGARPSVAWQTWYELAVGERRARTEPLPTELAESGFVLRVG